MIRIGFCSDDYALKSILSSALGKDFQIVSESVEPQEYGSSQVLIVDMGSEPKTLPAQMDSLRHLVQSRPSLAIILLADDSMRSAAAELVRLGAFGYCRRPPSIRDLKAMLRRACENASLKLELQSAKQKPQPVAACDRMIGSSPKMQQVYDLVRRVAAINASVLVIGESGTGKELIANAIHNLGTRSDCPFVAVSCGAIPETLIEAELFGHDKGAFTGTVGARVGLLEQAGEGTLFMDEIGELSLATQVKLLRVLQQREFSRLGSNKLIPLKARLIFATHQDLAEMVTLGKFRQDLYYRINVMRIDAPSLKERPGDLPEIATHFLREYSQMYAKPMSGIEPEAMSALQLYSWPGNVRELENVIQRAIIVAHGETITIDDLPEMIQEDGVVSIEDYQPTGSFERKIRDYKLKLALAAVNEHNGNKTLAARSLNISRAYLHRLIRVAEPELAAEPDDPEQPVAEFRTHVN
jgi:DNA-binding NtrC family response regulator